MKILKQRISLLGCGLVIMLVATSVLGEYTESEILLFEAEQQVKLQESNSLLHEGEANNNVQINKHASSGEYEYAQEEAERTSSRLRGSNGENEKHIREYEYEYSNSGEGGEEEYENERETSGVSKEYEYEYAS